LGYAHLREHGIEPADPELLLGLTKRVTGPILPARLFAGSRSNAMSVKLTLAIIETMWLRGAAVRALGSA
jgi:hypothetical protein